MLAAMRALTCDIFCRVIDNLGDAAVCWRLAHLLHGEHGFRARLIIDDATPLAQLSGTPLNDLLGGAAPEGVAIHLWQQLPAEATPADLVIEAFACDPPSGYVLKMAVRKPAPAWVNLEYLSAEPWVDTHHALDSPHPKLPLVKRFFFPGFTDKTGGLLREAWIPRRFDQARATASATLAQLGAAPRVGALQISLFSYPAAPVAALLAACTEGPRDIDLWRPSTTNATVRVEQSARLRVIHTPFFTQDRYDLLLAACDLNFVRGEDSFVRAQWAARPLVWHIYPQAEDAHLAKLTAFLSRYLAGLDPVAATAWRSLHGAWNAAAGWGGAMPAAWAQALAHLPAMALRAGAWRQRLLVLPKLTEGLAEYAAGRLK